MWIGSARRLAASVLIPITISGHTINHADSVIGALECFLIPWLFSSGHINKLVSNWDRSPPSTPLVECSRNAFVRAMILSRLDNCNGVYLPWLSPEIFQQQIEQWTPCVLGAAAARLFLNLPRVCHIKDAMREYYLHWLEFPNRVAFKLSTLAISAACTDFSGISCPELCSIWSS